MAPSTRQTYRRALQAYISILPSQTPSFPATHQNIVKYISHLVSANYAPGTVITYVSALSFVNKLYGHPDPLHNFVIKKILEGTRKLAPSADKRLPITIPILHRLIDAIQVTLSTQHYTKLLLTSMFLLAFHAFLRIGEITTRNKNDTTSTLQARDCTITINRDKLISMEITLRDPKHNHGKAFNFNIRADNTPYCPVAATHNYLTIAKPTQGPLFQFAGGCPVTRSFFDKQLQAALQAANYDPTHYKGHSFRIGAATEAVGTLGMSEHLVQHMGRWKSNAFKNYIRIPQFNSCQF